MMNIKCYKATVPSGFDNNSGGYIDKTIAITGFTEIIAIIPVMNMYRSPSTSSDYGYVNIAVKSNTLTEITVRIFKAYGGYVYPEFDVYIIGR